MKMIVAVVRDEYAGNLTDLLTQKGFGATKLASTGGFLKAGNTTFLIGVAATQLEEVLGLIRSVCMGKGPAREELYAEGGFDSAAVGVAPPASPTMTVAGATVFVLDVARMVKV
jgi:uncharacterized protein YaaQ